MTFKIIRGRDGKGKVQNTESTTASFNEGSVNVEGDFENSGDVNVDVRANLSVAGNVINSGNFNIRDFVTEKHFEIMEKAISDLSGAPKEYLSQTYEEIKSGNVEKANSWFRKFYNYVKKHPVLVTSSIQILLQLFK